MGCQPPNVAARAARRLGFARDLSSVRLASVAERRAMMFAGCDCEREHRATMAQRRAMMIAGCEREREHRATMIFAGRHQRCWT